MTPSRRLSLFFLVSILMILVACNSSRIHKVETNPTDIAAVNSLLKITTEDEGFYTIDINNLYDESTQPGMGEEESLGLIRNGEFQPLWIEKEKNQTRIYFYAPANASKYTKQQVTILGPREDLEKLQSLNGGEGIQQDTASPFKYINNIPSRMKRFEENHSYHPQVRNGDHWLWEVIQPSGFITHQMALPKIHTGDVYMAVDIWGMTEADIEPDHHIYLEINGWKSDDFYWDGRGYHRLEVKVPSGVFKEEGNDVKVHSPGDTGSDAEINWLDSFTINYPVKLEPIDEQIEFVQGIDPVDLRHFNSDVDIYNVNNFEKLTRVSENLKNDSEWSGKPGTRYRIISKNGYLSPKDVTPFFSLPDYHDDSNSADYIIIAAGEWEKDVEPLLKIREEQGLQPLFMPVEAIYDQFQWGYPEPQAIRQFLKYTQENWKTPPRYVLLLGDATYDTRGYLGQENPYHIPTFFVESQFGGETISDTGYYDLKAISWPEKKSSDENYSPGFAVGRIPVQNQNDVRAIIKKIIKYEQSVKNKSLSSKVLMVADGQDSGFQQDAQSVGKNLSVIPEYFFPGPSSPDLNDELLILWENAYDYIFYFGHGSIQQWGKDRIFSSEDVTSLPEQDIPPIVVQFTCLTGFFSHPGRNSLSEDLILNPNGGAIGLLAPTSLTLPQDQNFLGVALTQEIEKGETSRLGDLLVQTWQQYLAKINSSVDVYQTFLLIGDPALTLP